MNTCYRATLISLLALALIGCAVPDTRNPQVSLISTVSPAPTNIAESPKPIIDNRPNNRKVKLDDRLVESSTSFGFNLFDRLAKQDPKKNIFISPSSVAIALSMTYNGASGETQEAIAKALELQNIKIDEVNDFNWNIQQLLANGDTNVELSIANSLWARKDIALKQTFLNKVKEFYQAEISNLDFKDPNAANTINAWVKKNTKDKIDKIVDRIEPDSMLFLINAVYFKGKWESPFEKSLTKPQPFTLADGAKIQHPAMSRSGEYRYYDAPTFQAISLPYGTGRFSMEIFLPKPKSNLLEFQKQLTAKNWQEWSTKFTRKEGLIQLPRFKVEYETSLKSALQNMDMAIAFDPDKADFRNLSNVKAFIGDVKHKTFVEVNEEGTEAAAATSIEMKVTSAMPSEESPFQMIVDRPFFFAISDRQTGTIIFMGAIKNPK
ncbi:serpin family protein [Pseudanabaena sp. UWO311]|uniref:serpin family protein n=1 Tax=Pseudanabaena sp. UWO311 TaxID=2487337 RepID=UPI001159CA47|nr:serpin family protein [Pseudanabaena sp. UWO311]TYQ29596.1 serpin family protein [Pseudanabaena sp. UWO311]